MTKTRAKKMMILGFLMLVSCQSRQAQENTSSHFAKIVKAQWIVAEKREGPKVVTLDSMPKAKVTKVTSKPLSKPAGFFHFMQNYTSEQGLALDSIRCGMTDRAGNLWFGTFGGGASKFDGKTFTNYFESLGLASDTVQSILEDSKGNIWFGTNAGASKYDGVTFTNFKAKQGLAHDDVSNIFEDKSGNLWFATAKGASRFDGKTFKNFSQADGLANNSISTISQDHNGMLWFATANGASRFDGKSFTNYTTSQGLASNTVRKILEDKNGKLWFATLGGVSQFDGQSFASYSKDQGLASNDVLTMAEDSLGNLWFATFAGVSRFNGKSFENLNAAQGLANDEVHSILKDKAGNLWFGTNGGGINKFQGKAFTNYRLAEGMPETSIYNVVKDQAGHLWLGTNGMGVVTYDGTSFITLTKAQGLASNSIFPLLKDKEQKLWFGTADAGVIKYDGTTFTTYSQAQGLPDDFVTGGIEDSAGALWFATGSGASRFDGKSFTNYSVAQGLVDNTVFAIHQDNKGMLWFATNGGISRFDGTSFTNFSKAQGLISNVVFGIFEDSEHNLWFSTGGGVTRYDGNTFLNYTTLQGLPDNSVAWATTGPKNRIFLGTNRGLAVLAGYRKDKDNIPAQNKLSNEVLRGYAPNFEVYNLDTGYPVKDTNQGSYFVDEEGVLWFGTGSNKTGLVRFDYAALHRNEKTPKVVILSIKINNEKVTKESGIQFKEMSKWYKVPQGLVLPHDSNNMTIEFGAIEPDSAQDILYQYTLVGYDKGYSRQSTQSYADFGNIFEGTYRFKVRAKGLFTDWSEPVVYTFKVLPPWYRTWWAYTLFGLAIATALYLIYLWRTKTLRRRQKELEALYESTERFLPRDFLRLLNKEHVQDVVLGDSVEVEIGVMFSDIREFTTLAEKLGPHKTVMVLNKYMGLMAPIVRKYNGVVDQFLGDGILAFFDVNPKDAIKAAFEMQATLPAFNKYLHENNIAPVKIGIALNVGPSILSIIGEERRLQGTVISDDVNLASRVENLNKFYTTTFLITGTAFDLITDKSQYLSVLVDKAIVVGRSKMVRIYALWPLPQGDALEIATAVIAQFYEAVASYEKGDFAKARLLFNSCRGQWPINDIPKPYIERCDEFSKIGAPQNWDGTIVLTQK